MTASEKPEMKYLGAGNWVTERWSQVRSSWVAAKPRSRPLPIELLIHLVLFAGDSVPLWGGGVRGGGQVHGSEMDSNRSWGSNVILTLLALFLHL